MKGVVKGREKHITKKRCQRDKDMTHMDGGERAGARERRRRIEKKKTEELLGWYRETKEH